MVDDLENRIVERIQQNGPQTGLELKETFSEDNLTLWQTCSRSKNLIITRVGTRYMRLDRRIDGYACLSPSILREFLSYSVIGLRDYPEAVAQKAQSIAAHIAMISEQKLELAHRIVSTIRKQCGGVLKEDLDICFIIAGDIVYNMAHDVPRPERSTGKLVRGSDIDLIIVLKDDAPDEVLKCLDDAIYSEKYRLLTSPAFREEIDYVIKKVERIEEQLQFDTFKRMIACKILGEGRLLEGSETFFAELKGMLKTNGVADKLAELENQARVFRENAEAYLLDADPGKAQKESLYLFYPHEESEEFD